jgi:ADP-ribose pyrophosphatase
VRTDELVDRERPRRFLALRTVNTALEGEDGAVTAEGTWDFVERPSGPDAVVVVCYRRGPRGTEVLLRSGVRVPISLGRTAASHGAGRHPIQFIEELVAGLVEPDETTDEHRRERARAELLEEAGIELPPSAVEPLGGPLWLAPGLCAELEYYFCADATDAPSVHAAGDGSPFEALGRIAWYPLDEAIARVCEGQAGHGDLRAEVGLRRLAARLAR